MADSSIQLGAGGSILFVGNSFTFGRVDPVMSYNTDNVRDLTAPVPGTTFANTSGSNLYEPHPWGGVPGLFQAFADQAGLELDVAISARNAATLQGQYLNSNPAGWDLRGNVASQAWDTVVLQDNSTQPLPSGTGSITFAAGSSTATLIIHPTADTTVETDETIGLQITANAAYRTSAGVVTGTILNDDPTGPVVNPALPTVTLVASPGAVLEDSPDKLVYTFTRTGPTTSALTVNFTAFRDGSTAPSVASGSNADFVVTTPFTGSFVDNTGHTTTGSISFTSNTGSIVIPAGATSVTFTLDPKTDPTVEPDESIRLTLSANAAYNVGTPGPVSATILNDDFAAGTDLSVPNISLSLASSGVYEDGSGNLVYEFARSGSNTAPLTVNFNVSGTATLPGNDFTVTGANSFSTAGAEDPDLQSFNTYAVKFAQYATTGTADGAVPANPHANPATEVYLYETWARPNMVTGARVANTDDTTGAVTTTTTTAPEYYVSLEAMTADLRTAYEGLAAANPIFAGVAPVGAAFLNAVQNGTAMRDPYTPDAGKVDLWWDDNLHASKYGSYLSGLTLFGTLTGLDPRSLGAAEHVASDLGITQAEAAALQAVAAATLGFALDAHWTAPGKVTELQGGATGMLATEGSFGFSDSDIADTHAIAVAALTPGARGTFSAALHTDTTGDGTGGSVNWLFTVDNAAVAGNTPGATHVEHFLVTLSDANGGLAQRDVAVTINASYNAAPTDLAIVAGPEPAGIGQSVSFTGSASDPDGDALTYVWDFGDGTAAGVGASQTHTYAAPGTFTATLAVTDTNGATSIKDQTITIENHAPVANAGGPYALQNGASLTLDGSGSSDPDTQYLDVLTYAWDLDGSGLGNGQSPDATGAAPTLTAAQLQALGITGGSYAVTLQVSDSYGGVSTVTTTLFVNNPPTVVADNPSITEDATPNTVSGNVLSNDSDPNGDTPAVGTPGSTVLPHGTLALNADGSYTYTLDNANAAVNALKAGQSLTDSYAYTVIDGHGGTSSAQIDIKINGANDAPVLGGDDALTVAEGGLIAITTADLTATDVDNTNAELVYAVTATSHGSVQVNGATTTTFTQDDIVNGRVKFLHDGGELDGSFSVSLSDGAASGGNATVTATVNPHINDAPTVGDITLPAIAVNSGAHTITEAQLLANASDAEGDTLHATNLHIESGLGALVDNHNGSWTYTPKINDDTDATFAFQVDDGQSSTTGHAKLDITPVQSAPAIGTTGNDTFTAVTGNSQFDGGLGTDTITFDFKLTDAVVSFVDNTIIVDGPTSHTVLTGIEVFKFTDGTVNNNDGNPLVDDLFYYANNHDVWLAGADADAHFAVFGWKEGRDPNAFFSTKGYLAAYADVKAAGINPLTHYDVFGWTEGRDPSPQFDTKGYLAAYPDVKAAGVDPLAQFLLWGEQEGRHAVNDGHFG